MSQYQFHFGKYHAGYWNSVPMSRYDLGITDTQYMALIQAKCNRTDIYPLEWHTLLEK